MVYQPKIGFRIHKSKLWKKEKRENEILLDVAYRLNGPNSLSWLDLKILQNLVVN